MNCHRTPGKAAKDISKHFSDFNTCIPINNKLSPEFNTVLQTAVAGRMKLPAGLCVAVPSQLARGQPCSHNGEITSRFTAADEMLRTALPPAPNSSPSRHRNLKKKKKQVFTLLFIRSSHCFKR